jgi:hypothetical protein
MSEENAAFPPSPPVEPEPWECCGSGCEPCVYDRYWEELARYEEALARWRKAVARRGAQDRRPDEECDGFDNRGVSP